MPPEPTGEKAGERVLLCDVIGLYSRLEHPTAVPSESLHLVHTAVKFTVLNCCPAHLSRILSLMFRECNMALL